MGAMLDKALFVPPKPSYTVSSFPGQLVCLAPRDGDRMPATVGLILPFSQATHVLLVLHGNAVDIGHCHSHCERLRDAFQMNVLILEYPGYGVTADTAPRSQDVDKAAHAAMSFLHGAGWARNQIVIFGTSIGCGPAITLAASGPTGPLGALILYAPFESVSKLTSERVGTLANSVLRRSAEARWNNIEGALRVSCPTLLLHGGDDKVVPIAHSNGLIGNLGGESKLCPHAKLQALDSWGHDVKDWEELIAHASLFLDERLQKSRNPNVMLRPHALRARAAHILALAALDRDCDAEEVLRRARQAGLLEEG